MVCYALITRCSFGHRFREEQMRRLRLQHPAIPRDSVANPLVFLLGETYLRLQARGV